MREISDDVGQDIETDHVGEAEAAGTGPTQDAASQYIHVFYREALLLHQCYGLEHDVDADAVGDEVGRVMSVDDGFAEAAVGEIGDGRYGGRIGVGGGNDLKQPHVSGGLKKWVPNQERRKGPGRLRRCWRRANRWYWW